MERQFEKRILRATGTKGLGREQTIQELWDGYGWIRRIALQGGEHDSVIVKLVDPPAGQNNTLSHKRKLKSYRVESAWYRNWSSRCSGGCRVPRCIAVEQHGTQLLLVLEDLDGAGFPLRTEEPDFAEIGLMLNWLAEFHAEFLGEQPEGLWKNGTYWHLDTRPDELKQIRHDTLRAAAGRLDLLLKQSRFKTIVHGDAKPANFCFSRDGAVAAVDFQYAGGGCGMKDVAYLLAAPFCAGDRQELEAGWLDSYFDSLAKAVRRRGKEVDLSALEEEWRRLYPVARLDFDRFLAGWSPGWYRHDGEREQLLQQILQK